MPANRNRQHAGPVLVVGSINEDIILRVPRAPRPGETLTADSVTRRPGGKGANQAAAAARANADVRLVGRVGDDDAGARMLDDLRAAGVRTDLVKASSEVATGSAYITVTPDGENMIVLDPGANARLSRNDLAAAGGNVASAAVMLAQLEVPVDTVAVAVRTAVQAGVRPVVTLSPAQPVPAELLDGLDPVLVNEQEAALLLGRRGCIDDPEQGARDLLARGPRAAVITLGARGAVLATRKGVTRMPAAPVDVVVDTTGAGDAFAGTLAAALAAGQRLDQAVEVGLNAAATAVGRLGAR